MSRLRKTCPGCGGRNVARIMYGYPVFSEELQRELDEGRIVLGGCVVTGDDPAQECRDCGLRWGGRATG